MTESILRAPTAAFDWKVGEIACRGYVGQVNGRSVVLFVAKEGIYRGTIMTAVAPDAARAAMWGIL